MILDLANPLFDNRIDDSDLNECDVDLYWLDTRSAARYLCIPEGSLRNLTSMGSITYFKLGRKNLYRKQDLDQLLLPNKRGKGGLL